MKTMQLQICVPPERVVTLKLPDDVSPGEHRVVVVIDEPEGAIQQTRPPLFNPEGILSGLGAHVPFEDFKAGRLEMWGRATDEELNRPGNQYTDEDEGTLRGDGH